MKDFKNFSKPQKMKRGELHQKFITSQLRRNISFAFLANVLICTVGLGQNVNALWTDYNGFWTSSSSSINAIEPDNSHNLLAFRYNGIVYSTGVNDGALNTNNVTFTPGNWRALPLNQISAGVCPPSTSDSYLIMLAPLVDGVLNGGSTPPPFPVTGPNSCPTQEVMASFLTRGLNGLDLGSGLANIPSGNVLSFPFSNNGITLSNINDGVPDILITQVLGSLGNQDVLRIVDGNGNVVGNSISINQAITTIVAKYRADIYLRNGTIVNGLFGGITPNSSREIRLLAFELSDFGINSTNYTQATKLEWQASGSSDPAFFAFNEPSISIPTNLAILSQPNFYVTGAALNPGFTVVVKDNQGLTITEAGTAITASVETGNGTLNGSFTAATDANGVATFSNLILNGNGNQVIKFSSSSLTPASSSALVDCIAGDLTIGTTAAGANYSITNGMLIAEGTATIAVSDIINHLENIGDLVIHACGGELFISANISPNLPTSRVLSFKAEGDIVVDDIIAVSATGSALNLIFWSDLNGDEQGGVLFRAGSSIQSNNGHIWIGGGAGSTTWNGLTVGNSYAVGLSNTLTGITTTYSGINAVGNAINAGSGDLYLSGKSTQTDYRFGIGVRLNSPVVGVPMAINGRNITILGIGSENANSIGQDFNRGNWGVGIENTAIDASGAITIEGAGGGQNLTSSITNGGGNHGVRVDNTSSIVTTGSGNIAITGTGGSPSGASNTDNDGLRIDGGVIRVNSGTLTLLGTAGTNNNSEDIQYSEGTSESRNPSNTLASGAIEIKANTLTIASGVRFRTNGGNFRIQPRTPATSIGIAGATGTLSLLSSYFSTNFESGFNTISIGSEVQTGNIACNTVTFRDHTTLQTSGSLTFGGDITTNADKNLTLINNDLSFNSLRTFNIDGAFAYIPFGANFTSDVTFPMTNLTLSSTIKGLTIGKSGNDKNITVNASVNGNQDVRLFGNEIQLNENIDCGNIVLEGPTTLTAGKYINAGNLTHNGNITLSADAGSGAFSQLRFTGSYAAQPGNTITQEQRLSGGWHNIAVPVSGITAGMLGQVGTNRHPNAQNLRYWDAAVGNWVNVVDNAAPLIAGRGYSAFVGPNGVQTAAGVISATGALITSVNPIMEFNINPPAWADFGNGEEDGWNLVANPFCATLDFTTLTGRTTSNVDNSFHIWNPAGNAYVSWANAAPADGIIPPMQSFWVRAQDNSSPSLGTLTYANTTVSATPSFRKTESISDHVLLRVSEVAQPENADVLTFALTYDNATDGFDNDWDARKMMNPGATPSLYSLGGGLATSINAIAYGPAEVNSKMIPLGMRVQTPTSAAFSIALDDSYLNNHYDIYLEDSKRKVFHNMKEDAYRFVYDADEPHRFKLHFGANGVDADVFTLAVSGWVFGNDIYIRSNDYQGPLRWYILDVNGREVQRSGTTRIAIGETHLSQLTNFSSGIYILQIVTEQGVRQVKFQR